MSTDLSNVPLAELTEAVGLRIARDMFEQNQNMYESNDQQSEHDFIEVGIEGVEWFCKYEFSISVWNFAEAEYKKLGQQVY